MSGAYRYFEHTADVGIEIRARSKAELFRTAALALMEWIGPRPDGPPTVCQDVVLEGEGIEELFVRWLQELVFRFQYRLLYIVMVESMRVSDKSLQAEVKGVAWNDSVRQDYREVKAITYHKLSVRKDGRSWRATVILDV